MKYIGDICINMSKRLGIELITTDNVYNIEAVLDDKELEQGLVCVAARSGVGKTTFALDVVMKQAVKTDKTILIFSCEKSAEQIVAQLVMKLCALNMCFINADDQEKAQKLSQALGFLSKQNIYFEEFEQVEYPALSDIEKLVAEACNVGLVMIDGVYCLYNDASPAAINETKMNVRVLKEIAKKAGAPIIITTNYDRSEIKRMLSGDMSNNALLNSGVDRLIVLYRSVVGTTISNSTDFLLTDSKGRCYPDTLYYDTKNRRFQRNAD